MVCKTPDMSIDPGKSMKTISKSAFAANSPATWRAFSGFACLIG
jgi:hypothetical protein